MAMKLHKWSDVRTRLLTQEQLAEVDRQVDGDIEEMSLRELREALGLTQVQAAEAAKMTQGELSRTERRENHLFSTLQRYVAALGGEVEVYATVGGKRVRLVGV